MMKPFPFKLGADPEFNIVMNNKRIDAHHLFNGVFRTKDHKSKYKEESMGYKIGEAGNVGWDGCASTAEIRPAPSDTAVGIATNLRTLLEAAAQNTQLFDFITLSEKASVGGHIHFQLPDGYHGNTRKLNRLVRVLLSYYLPLLAGENQLNSKLRAARGYGSYADYRTQHVGNEIYTLEMRAPSAEWLTTERVARATFAYMGTVYNEIIKNPSKASKYIPEELKILNNEQASVFKTIVTTNMLALVKRSINKIKKQVKTFEFYDQYKDDIDFILDAKKVLAEKEKNKYNIMRGWKLERKVKCSKRAFVSGTSVNQLAKEVNLEELEGALFIPYNDDTNVSSFVSHLKRRVLAHKMKMKYSYFIFGIKDCFNDIVVRDKNGSFYHGAEQIKSAEDMEIVHNIFARMDSRFFIDSANLRTGARTDEEGTSHILIGIPYKMRVDNMYKPLLEFVYNLEKGKGKDKPVARTFLSTELPSNEETEIYRTYTSRPMVSVQESSSDAAFVATVTDEWNSEQEELANN